MASKENATSGELVAKAETQTAELLSQPQYTTNGADPDSQFAHYNEVLTSSLTPASELQAEALRFKPLTFTELLARPAKQWLVDQVFGAGDLIMVYGPPGCGKTFILIDIVFAVSLARSFARRFCVARPLNVAYCAGEGIGGLSQRFAAAAASYQTEALPGFRFYENVPQLFNDGGDTMDRFIAEQLARQEQGAPAIDLLIIDTLHSATVGAEENSAKDMGLARDRCLHAARALGCAVLLAHHTNKAGSGERGSSALRGAMDCMIELKEFGQKYAMYCAKLKDGEQWKPQPFDLVEASTEIESVRVWWDDPGDLESGTGNERTEAILAELAERPGVKFTAASLGEVVGVSRNAASNILVKLVRQGKIERGLQDEESKQSSRNPWVYFALPENKGDHPSSNDVSNSNTH